MTDGYGREPGLELTTGGCTHDRLQYVRELEHETRVVCGDCRSVLPRRFGFWPGGYAAREQFEESIRDLGRRTNRDLLRARLEREKAARRAVREAMRVLPVFRTPDAPRGRYAPTPF